MTVHMSTQNWLNNKGYSLYNLLGKNNLPGSEKGKYDEKSVFPLLSNADGFLAVCLRQQHQRR